MKLISNVILTFALSSTAWAQSPPEIHFALTPGLVAQTLARSGMQIAEEQVSLPAKVVATEPNPALDIVSQLGSRVKLSCRLPGTCLPFYADISKLQGTPNNALPKAKPEITMRAGSHATLILDDHRAHIQVAVISLENGVAGKWIRVASPDHKQLFMGQVVNASELRGSF